ncbi:MAG: hypothetical protein R3B07_34605 [Polyangiaceae bacterium]
MTRAFPEDEYNPNFASFSSEEAERREPLVPVRETRVCLVKFQGRVSCPYGSPGLPDGVAPADANAEQIKNLCSIPGTDPGSGSVQDKVTAAVTGQLVDRREDRAVYCSCRCANAQGNKDDGATYCDCPSGFSCEKLVDDVGLGGTQLAGSYCVKEGTITRSEPEQLARYPAELRREVRLPSRSNAACSLSSATPSLLAGRSAFVRDHRTSCNSSRSRPTPSGGTSGHVVVARRSAWWRTTLSALGFRS